MVRRKRICGGDEFIDFSAHIELGFETGNLLGKNLYNPMHGKRKNELMNSLLNKSLRIWTVNFTREGVILILVPVSSTIPSRKIRLQWVLKHN